jgi:hypothetical protein
MPHRRRWWIWVLALIAWGCGSHSVTPVVKITRSSRAIWCASRLILPTHLSKPTRPAARSFDTRALLGQAETKAAAETRRRGCLWRVVRRGGHDLTVTADARGNRVDASIIRGIVVATGVF